MNKTLITALVSTLIVGACHGMVISKEKVIKFVYFPPGYEQPSKDSREYYNPPTVIIPVSFVEQLLPGLFDPEKIDEIHVVHGDLRIAYLELMDSYKKKATDSSIEWVLEEDNPSTEDYPSLEMEKRVLRWRNGWRSQDVVDNLAFVVNLKAPEVYTECIAKTAALCLQKERFSANRFINPFNHMSTGSKRRNEIESLLEVMCAQEGPSRDKDPARLFWHIFTNFKNSDEILYHYYPGSRIIRVY